MGLAADAVEPREVIALLSDLVRIESVNPLLVPGAPGEAALAADLARRLAAMGLSVELPEAAPGRPNVIARLRGTGTSDTGSGSDTGGSGGGTGTRGKTLILNAHMDTVGVAGMTIPPFEPRIEDGRLYGRGSSDTKAGLAAMIAAVQAIQRAGLPLRGDVVIAAVADEEYSSLGTAHMARTVRGDGCIIAESTALKMMVAHQGFAWYEIETIGRAAHGMHPEHGIDAIAMMGRVLAELERLDREVISKDVHPLAGRAVFHNGTISGGSEPGIYPARCSLQIEIGCNPGETMAVRRAEIDTMLARLAADDPRFQSNVITHIEREPFDGDPEAEVVRALGASVAAVTGRTAAVVGENAWMDAALVQAAGIPTVVFGPDGHGFHAAVEWVLTDQVVASARILAETIARFCS